MASIADVYVTVLPETGKIADGIEKALRAVDVRAAARKWREEIERELGKADTTVDVDADTAAAKKKIQAVEESRYKAKIHVEVDQASLAKARAQLSAAGGKAGSSLGGLAKGEALTAAVGLAPNVVPLIGGVVQAVSQLSGVVGLIPAVYGTAGLAFASLKIGVSGFGDAIKEVGDPTKFAEAIKQLSPAAQGAASAIQGLMPQVTQLKMTVQDALFTGMGEQFSKLGNTYLPIFQTVMSQMTGSANRAAIGISKMLQTPEMQGDIKKFGANSAAAFDTLSTAAQPFVKALADIATVGSGFLPQLAETVKELADRFGAFITDARDSGKLAGWIQGGIDAFTELKDIAVNVWNAVKGIFDAADSGGQGFLSTIETLTGKLSDWVNSTAGQTQLKTFFEEGRATLEKWKPLLEDLPGIAYNMYLGFKSATDLILPVLKEITDFLARHPGLIQNVVIAYATWSTITGVASLLNSLTLISTMLAVTLPASAATGAAGVSTALLGTQAAAATAAGGIRGAFVGALAGVSLGTMTIGLAVAGGALAIWAGEKLLEAGRTISLPVGDVGAAPTVGADGTVTTGQQAGQLGGGGGGFGSAGPDQLAARGDFGVPRNKWGGLPPSSGPHAKRSTPPPVPSTSNYAPPPPMPGGGGGGGAGGAGGGEPKPPPGMSYTYSGYGELNWEALAQAEAGGNWSMNSGNGFYGGLQFDQPTWESVGGLQFAERADLADKSDQIKAATALYNSRGAAPWPANGWLLTATPEQLQQAGLTGSGRLSSPRGGGGGGAGPGFRPQPYGLPGGTSTGGYSSGIPQSSWATSLGQQFGLKPSTYPGHQESNRGEAGFAPNPQGLNRGIDWTGSPEQMRQLAEYLMQHPGFVEQLIYQDPETGKSYEIAGGKPSPGYYGAGTLAQHRGHAHTRQSQTFPGPQDTMAGYTYDGPGGDPNNPMYTESKDSGGEQLGKDIIAGMLDVFGFGDIFKSPLDFESFKLFKGIMGIPGKMFGGEAQGTQGGLGGAAGGGGGPGGFISNLLQGFGALNPGSPGNAPGEFIPGMGGGAGGSGGISGFLSDMVPGAQPGQQGGMQDNSFNVNIQAANANARDFGPIIDEYQAPHARNLARSSG